MKKLVIAIAILIIIGGVSIVVLKTLGVEFFEESEGEPVVEAQPVEPPRFVEMDPLVIPLFQGSRTAGTIQPTGFRIGARRPRTKATEKKTDTRRPGPI